MTPHQRELDLRWAAWLQEQNRRGTRVVLWIVLALYPAFGVLDYLLAPASALPMLWGTRMVITAATCAMFAVLRMKIFERFYDSISSGYMVIIAFGIVLMTVTMGGLSSHYYAGLSLVSVGTGLLFVWPPRIVLATHLSIILSFVLVNLLSTLDQDVPVAISNLAFLSATAIITGTGQFVLYRSQHKQVMNQIALEETKASLEKAHGELKALDSFKSQLFANITHEFKTPLAMLLAPLELILQDEMGELTSAQRTTFESMFRSGLKLLKMIGDLLDLSRLEESQLRLKVAEHDLAEYLKGLVAQVQPLAQRKGIELALEVEPGACLVFCDIERIERVFMNLISNATKFTPTGGHVKVRLRSEGAHATVLVEDDGPGFPPEKAEHIFQRFYQVDMGGTRRYGGTGIGLALAKEIVELHGGRIHAESSAGAKFTVELPRDRDHFLPEVLDRRGSTREIPEGQRATDRGVLDFAVQMSLLDEYRLLEVHEATERRVSLRDSDEDQKAHLALVVDDTPDIIRLVHNSLRAHFKVISAEDGLKGLEMALRERPSLIIADLMMPGIDGLELTRRLRGSDETRHIPILMLTAKGDLEDRVAGLETGVSAYLAKPFSPRELLTTARALVQAQETTADIVLTQRMDSLEIVAGGLAHEINNPLNYLKNALAKVKMDADAVFLGKVAPDDLPRVEKRVRELFDIAESGIKRIAATVELMSSYSKAGYSRQIRPHDVFAAIREVVSMVLPATGRAVQVDMELTGDGMLECVPEEFNQVLSNLVQNAIEAAPEAGGQVRLRAYREDENLVISVKDNGPGVRSEDIQRIFTPFFTTKGPGRGMGMGLTIAWRVTQSLGGTLEVRPGLGAEFVIRVPRKQSRLRAVS
ncbi:MAG TPA: ATP-binding protein [Myxococcales bacterium]|nr:ATP-binding protein [Myxococcales bacterium]